jgi:hypothetical protein
MISLRVRRHELPEGGAMGIPRLLLTCLLAISAVAWVGCGDSSSPAGGDPPPPPDTQGPQFAGAFVDTVAPNQVRVVFDEKIIATTAAGFTVTANGPPATITTMFTFGDSSLALQLIADVDYPDHLTVAYDSTTGNVTDRADPANRASSFGPISVNNRIPNLLVTIAGGNGSGDTGDGGLAIDAQFNEPQAVVVQGGAVYVADHRSTAIRKFDIGGNIETVLASPLIGRPRDIWFSNGDIYTAANVHCIVEYDFAALAEVVGGRAFMPGDEGDGGLATAAKMTDPHGVWVTGDTVYVADTVNDRIRKFIIGGNIETVAGTGSSGGDVGDGGLATAASVRDPFCVRRYQGEFYVCTSRGRIRKFTEGGTITSIVSTGLNQPQGIFVHEGYVYIADTDNHAIRRVPVTGDTLETIAGGIGAGYAGDGGPATEAQLNSPYGVCVHDGYLYIADTFNHAVRRMHVPRLMLPK